MSAMMISYSEHEANHVAVRMEGMYHNVKAGVSEVRMILVSENNVYGKGDVRCALARHSRPGHVADTGDGAHASRAPSNATAGFMSRCFYRRQHHVKRQASGNCVGVARMVCMLAKSKRESQTQKRAKLRGADCLHVPGVSTMRTSSRSYTLVKLTEKRCITEDIVAGGSRFL